MHHDGAIFTGMLQWAVVEPGRVASSAVSSADGWMTAVVEVWLGRMNFERRCIMEATLTWGRGSGPRLDRAAGCHRLLAGDVYFRTRALDSHQRDTGHDPARPEAACPAQSKEATLNQRHL